AVFSLLFRHVAVALVGGESLGVGEPLRVVLVRVAGQQRADRAVLGDPGVQAVNLRCVLCSGEGGAVGVRRGRVGAAVVVERDVLVEDHDYVLDRCSGVRDYVIARGYGRGRSVPGESWLRRGCARGGRADGTAGCQGERCCPREVGPEPALVPSYGW